MNFLITVDVWHMQRKLVTPAFHFKILEDFISIFHSQTDYVIDIFGKHNDEIIYVYPYLGIYNIQAFCGN